MLLAPDYLVPTFQCLTKFIANPCGSSAAEAMRRKETQCMDIECDPHHGHGHLRLGQQA